MSHVGQCKRWVLYHNVCLNYGIRFMYFIHGVLKAGISTAEWVSSSVSVQRRYPLYGSYFRVRWHNVTEKVLVLKAHLCKLSPISHYSWRLVTRNGSQVEYYVASKANRSHGLSLTTFYGDDKEMRGKGIFGPMKISKSITFVRQLGNPELPHLAVHSIFPP
jgi:hypothetical protein